MSIFNMIHRKGMNSTKRKPVNICLYICVVHMAVLINTTRQIQNTQMRSVTSVSLLKVQWVPGLFPGVKGQGRGVDHTSPSTAHVKERSELHMYSLLGLHGLF